MRTAIKLITTYIALSLVIGLISVCFSYPNIPSTAAQWFQIFALALPVQLAAEFLGERLWNNKATRLVEQRTAEKSFSLLRILYGVLMLLMFGGLIFAFPMLASAGIAAPPQCAIQGEAVQWATDFCMYAAATDDVAHPQVVKCFNKRSEVTIVVRNHSYPGSVKECLKDKSVFGPMVGGRGL